MMSFCQKLRLLALLVMIVLWMPNLVKPALAGDPYDGICQRNAFRLKPRLAVATPPTHAPFPKIRLTGITTILRGKRALLKVELPGKPADKAESYILTEGQKSGPLKVLQINDLAAQVVVDYSGTITNLTFDKPPPTPSPRPTPATSRQALRYRTVYH